MCEDLDRPIRRIGAARSWSRALCVPTRCLHAPPALLPLIAAVIIYSYSILADDGQPSSWFNQDAHQQRDFALASMNGTVNDDELNRLVAQARLAYQDSFSFSSRERCGRVAPISFIPPTREVATWIQGSAIH